jgi:hypothetical protein
MPLELQVSLLGVWIGADDVPVFAFFAGLLAFATIGVIQMIRVRTKWTWRHIVKGGRINGDPWCLVWDTSPGSQASPRATFGG